MPDSLYARSRPRQRYGDINFCGGQPIDCGPLLAAGPTLLAVLEKIGAATPNDSPAHVMAVNALEPFRDYLNATKPQPKERWLG
jgi:hypothetical protein